MYRAIQVYNSGFGGLNTKTGGSDGKTREEWAKDYDLDYPNKVISFASMFNVKDKEGNSYKTFLDELIEKPNVRKSG